MDEVLRKLQEIEQRLTRLEARAEAPATLQPSTPPVKPWAELPLPTPPAWRVGATLTETPPVVGMPAGQGASHIESYIGRWLLGIIGVVAVLFGVSFFLKYAFENNLIGETGRVLLGLGGGVLFVILGEVLRPRLEKYSYILSGGGLALFYLSIYAAFWFYNLITQTAAFGFMSIVTAFGVALSLWVGAEALAMLAAAGGFLTPYLLSTGIPNDVSFFTYLGILNLGILGVSFFKKWHALTLLGFVSTILNFASWYGGYYAPAKLFFTLYTLALFYVMYLLTGVASNLVARIKSDAADLLILTVNPVWFFGWCYFLLKPDYEYTLGFLAAGLGAIYIVFAYLASVYNEEDVQFTLFLSAIAVVFLTVAIPLQLEQNAITIAWGIEAAVLFLLGSMLANPYMRMFALGVFVVALIRLVALDSRTGDLAIFTAVFNKRFLTYAILAALSGVMGYIAVKNQEILTVWEQGVAAFLWTVVNVLVLVMITVELWTFFDARLFIAEQRFGREQQRQLQLQQPGALSPQTYGQYQYFAGTVEYRSIANQRNASVSVFWTLYAILLIALGMLYRSAFLRWSALILFGLTIGKVFLIDLANLKTPYRIISFMVLGLILLAASYLYFRRERNLESERNSHVAPPSTP